MKETDGEMTPDESGGKIAELKIPPVKKDYGGQSEEDYVRAGFFPKMKKVVAKVPFAADAIALYYAGFDKATPNWARAVAVAALAYFIMPIDLIPDALLIIGYTDDATVLALALKLLSRFVRPEHKKMARDWLAK